MENKGELVIRWLEEPMDMACTLCKSGKKRNFKKGPVVLKTVHLTKTGR